MPPMAALVGRASEALWKGLGRTVPPPGTPWPRPAGPIAGRVRTQGGERSDPEHKTGEAPKRPCHHMLDRRGHPLPDSQNQEE